MTSTQLQKELKTFYRSKGLKPTIRATKTGCYISHGNRNHSVTIFIGNKKNSLKVYLPKNKSASL